MTEQKYHHGDLRRKLIEAALEIISEKGLEKITMRGLGNRLNVSRTAPYRHFSDKNELLCAIAEEGYNLLNNKIKEANRAFSDSPLLRLKNIGFSYVEFALSNPVHYRLMFGNEIVQGRRTPELEKCAEELFGGTLHAIKVCQEENVIRQMNPYIIANAFWAMSHGIVSLLNDGQVEAANAFKGMPALIVDKKEKGRADVSEIVNRMTDILMNGISV